MEPLGTTTKTPSKILQETDVFSGQIKFNDKRYDEAIPLLRGPALCGDSQAQFLLGKIYSYGVPGVVPNEITSLAWLLLSARGGNAEAQFDLSKLAKIGSGVRAFWLIKAANQGYDPAIADLARSEERGEFGVQNYASAFQRWELLAKHGDAGAQTRLSQLCQFGLGVKRSPIQALMWMDVVVLSSGSIALDQRDPKLWRDQLAANMKKNDIDTAERQATNFLNTFGINQKTNNRH